MPENDGESWSWIISSSAPTARPKNLDIPKSRTLYNPAIPNICFKTGLVAPVVKLNYRDFIGFGRLFSKHRAKIKELTNHT